MCTSGIIEWNNKECNPLCQAYQAPDMLLLESNIKVEGKIDSHKTHPLILYPHAQCHIYVLSDSRLLWVYGLLSWLRGQSVCLQCRRPKFKPQVRKICWRRKWQPTPVLLPGKFHEWRSQVGYSPWGCKESTRLSDITFFISVVPFEEGNGNPLQCSCLENPMYRAAWWAAVYGVAKSWTWLSNSHTHTHTHTHRNFPNKHWSLLSCIGSTS